MSLNVSNMGRHKEKELTPAQKEVFLVIGMEEVWVCAVVEGYSLCAGEDGVGEYEGDSGQVGGVGGFEEIGWEEADCSACVCEL